MNKSESPMTGRLQKVAALQEDETLSPLTGPEAITLPEQSPTGNSATPVGIRYEEMMNSIRTAGWWLVGWTIVSLFQLNIPWALVLTTIALMSFYFYDVAAMFLVYAVMLFWAALWNLLVGSDSAWVFAGVVQVVLTVLACRDYRKYRTARADHVSNSLPQELSGLTPANRESHMAWLSLVLGVFGLLGLCALIPAGLAVSYLTSDTALQAVDLVLWAIWELGVLGIPVGIAAFSTGARPKGAAAAGIAFGILAVLMEIISVRMSGGG